MTFMTILSSLLPNSVCTVRRSCSTFCIFMIRSCLNISTLCRVMIFSSSDVVKVIYSMEIREPILKKAKSNAR